MIFHVKLAIRRKKKVVILRYDQLSVDTRYDQLSVDTSFCIRETCLLLRLRGHHLRPLYSPLIDMNMCPDSPETVSRKYAETDFHELRCCHKLADDFLCLVRTCSVETIHTVYSLYMRMFVIPVLVLI